MPSTEETQYPGAGTLYVYSASPHRGISPSRSNKRRQSPSMGAIVPRRWEDIVKTKEEPKVVSTPDSLLQNGIAGFTYLPYSSEGVLGRGKFSTVYKVIGYCDLRTDLSAISMLSNIPLCIPIIHLYLRDCCVNPLCWPNCRGIHVLSAWKAGFALKGISTSSSNMPLTMFHFPHTLFLSHHPELPTFSTNSSLV